MKTAISILVLSMLLLSCSKEEVECDCEVNYRTAYYSLGNGQGYFTDERPVYNQCDEPTNGFVKYDTGIEGNYRTVYLKRVICYERNYLW